MASKNTDIIEQLADTICGNLVTSSTRNGKETAPNDKTYSSIILGVNRKFTDDVTQDDINNKLNKFNIPETVDDGENNYYTFKLSGEYYCKQQAGDFKLYDNIMVYIPNGNWSRMYIDYPTSVNENQHIPETFVSDTEPEEGMLEGDYWVKVDSEDIEQEYYQYIINDETGELEWVFMFAASQGGSGVGEDVGHHSERFNGYESVDGNTITVTDLDPNTDREYNHAECYKNAMLNCRASHATGAQNSLTLATNTIIGGYNNNVTGGINNLIIGQNHTINNTGSSNRDSVIAGNLQGVSGAVASVVAGCLHTGTPTNSVIAGIEHILSPNNYCVTAGIGSVPASPLGNMICFIAANTTATGNTFLVDIAGNVFAYTYNTYGADYAEFFEWADGNPENEDRRGMLVSLDGEKIIPANGDDIIGIVSANPSVIGDSASFGWQGKFKRDVFGSIMYDDNKKPLISEEYDSNVEYKPRAVRPEWAAVGLVGKLIITDDGTCKINKYVIANNGIGTHSDVKTNIRVMKRIDDNHILVLIK